MHVGNIKTGLGRTGAAFATITGTGRRRGVLLAGATGAVAAVVGLAVPAVASPAAARPAAVTGTEHFQVESTSTNPNQQTNPIIAYGVFTAAGTDRSNNSNTVDTFAFPGGTVKVAHTTGKGQPQNPTFNPKTCLLTYHATGTLKITGGTGKYKGISGTGTYTLSLLGIGAKLKSGACNPSQNAAPAAFQEYLAATAKIKLP